MAEKSLEEANECRARGNRCYSQHKFFDALCFYNQSLCYAPPGSEVKALAFANRAAVYLECNLFEKCLENIQQALDENYPKPEIMLKRREKCLELMKTEEDPRFKRQEFNLSYPAHEKFPFMVECLEFRKDEKGLPHIYTNRDLHVGDWIAFQTPFSALINKDSNIHQRCSFCLKDNLFDLHPCQSCSKAMYCSEKCQTAAYDHYHRFECGINIEGFNPMPQRVFFEAMWAFKDDVCEMKTFLESNAGSKHFLLDFDLSDSTSSKCAQYQILAVDSLFNHRENTISGTDLLFEVLLKHLIRFPKIVESLKKHRSFIEKFLTKQFRISMKNCSSIMAYQLKLHKDLSLDGMNPVAKSYFPLMPCFQHSCAPNTTKIGYNGNILLYITRPTKAGGELFDCLGDIFELEPKFIRHIFLFDDFNLLCKCEACHRNYPLLTQMNQNKGNFNKYADREFYSRDQLDAMSTDEIQCKISEYCKVLDKNEDKFPSQASTIIRSLVGQCRLNMIKPEFIFKK